MEGFSLSSNMNTQVEQVATIVIGSLVSLGVLALGFGYLFGQWKRGGNEYNTSLVNNLKDLLKSEQEKNAILLKEKQELFVTLQAQITQNQQELAKLQGTVGAQTKMIEQYKELLTNRNPDLEKTLKEISTPPSLTSPLSPPDLTYNLAAYNLLKQALRTQFPVVLPPSPAVAGIYASVDASRGVWKAPANTGLQDVIATTFQISDELQGDMNIDATSGKSVNAIRAFTGKGILVWGARTLDGNSNDFK